MFTIKKMSNETIGYTAYACKTYTTHWDLAGRRAITLDADDGTGTTEPRKQIVVDSEVFIENGLGKTIEHFLPTAVTDASAGCAIMGQGALVGGASPLANQALRRN